MVSWCSLRAFSAVCLFASAVIYFTEFLPVSGFFQLSYWQPSHCSYSIRFRGTIAKAMVVYVRKKSFAYISIGLLVVLVFSRIFGSSQLWKELMGVHYDWIYKTTVQEGLELLGYMLIAYGSVLFYFQKDVSCSSRRPTKSLRSES